MNGTPVTLEEAWAWAKVVCGAAGLAVARNAHRVSLKAWAARPRTLLGWTVRSKSLKQASGNCCGAGSCAVHLR